MDPTSDTRQEPPPPPPPASDRADDHAPTAGMRALALILAVALAFAAYVLVTISTGIGDTATCAEVQAGQAQPNEDGECYDGSSTSKTAQIGLAWAGAAFAALATVAALFFAYTGRRSDRLLQITTAAIVLGGASILIGAL